MSVDGGCDAIKDGVRTRDIDATSQQYPENMARRGVTDIAEAVMYLADDAKARFITGTTLTVDGGNFLKPLPNLL